ncbi:BGTF surface domain-containing protein [Halobellus rubicundus]|uniref:BGTF surface domain-containing protein n=1 Tax=Halobellus rubicundus TaxID=2996466 RepID=A0ABD5MEA5_9EURY
MRSRFARVLLAAVVLTSVLAPAVFATPAAADPSVAIEYEGDRVTVASGPSQVIRGTADAPTGTEILVRVRSTGDTSPAFLKSESAVVTDDGTWAVAFNFSDIGAGGTIALTARFEDGSAETSVDGEIVACEGDCADSTPDATPTPIPEQTATPTRTDGADSPVAFGENIFLVNRGGVAAIPVSFTGDANAAVIVVGNETKVNYELDAVVRDEDGDGEAVLYVDTSLAGRGGETVSVSGGDTVDVRSETSLDAMLDPASYDVSLYAGTERDDPVDVGSLVVQEQSSQTPTSTPAEIDESDVASPDGDGLGPLALGGLVSGAFLVGGAALAAVLLRG